MMILCAVDKTVCGDGASGVCAAQHDKCPAKYIETPKPPKRARKRKEEYYEEETEETWKL